MLAREGVIDQPWVFIGGVLALKARQDLKAGEYQLGAPACVMWSRPRAGSLHQVTVPGIDVEQIVARLLDDDVLTGNIKEIREGSLLPDT